MGSHRPDWQWKPQLRCRSPEDPFFEEGNLACQLQYHKHICIELDQKENVAFISDFVCHQKNCNKTFASVLAFENHYNSVHRNACSVCFRFFPNQHLLDLHLAEQHDQMFQLMVAKKPMFKCLLENCPVASSTVEERKEHLITAHSYPVNFRFINLCKAIKKPGNGKKKKMESQPLHGEAASVVCESGDGITVAVAEEEKMDLSDHMEQPTLMSRKFQPKIPKNISFGHGVSRGFHRPVASAGRGKKNPWQQKTKVVTDTTVNIEDVKMDDLAESLGTN